MKKIALTLVCAASAWASGVAMAQDNAAAAGQANLLGCMFCHNAKAKLLGPSFESVADRYKDQADAAAVLSNKIKNGGAGVWGRVPMPAHNQVPDEQIATLVTWVLKGAPPR
jgi:cytochrome c